MVVAVYVMPCKSLFNITDGHVQPASSVLYRIHHLIGYNSSSSINLYIASMLAPNLYYVLALICRAVICELPAANKLRISIDSLYIHTYICCCYCVPSIYNKMKESLKTFREWWVNRRTSSSLTSLNRASDDICQVWNEFQL